MNSYVMNELEIVMNNYQYNCKVNDFYDFKYLCMI